MTHYQRAGKGRLLLLIHGWGDSAKGLTGLQTVLAADYEVVAVDLPGFGGTQAPPAVWDLDSYAAFLKAFLVKLDLPQPLAVIGHSNGGALAIRAVSLEQLQPKKLVLLAASGIRSTHKSKRLLLSIVAKIGNLATIWLPDRYRRALRKRLYGVAGSDLLVMPNLEATFKKTVRQDVQTDARKLQLPTLLVYAAQDKAVPVADGRRYQRLIAQARLEVVADAGHFVHLDQPKKVQSLIEEFLK